MKYSDEFINAALENMPNGLAYHKIVRDTNGAVSDCTYLDVNETFIKIMGKRREEIVGKNFTELFSLKYEAMNEWMKFFSKIICREDVVVFENYLMDLDKCIFVNGYKVDEESFITSIIDVNSFKAIQPHYNNEIEKIISREHQYRLLVNTTQDIMYSYDIEGKFIAVNKNFCHIIGKTQDQIIGKKIEDLVKSEKFIDDWNVITNEVISTKKFIVKEVKEVFQGKKVYYRINITPVFDLKGNIIAITGSCHDITSVKESEKTAKKMAYYDLLTDLANRGLFMEKLAETIEVAQENRTKFAYIFIDIDNFKRINDTFGHSVGDSVLVQLASIIEYFIREKGVVGRLSGDEFSILLPNIKDREYIEGKLEQIIQGINKPMNIGNDLIINTASIGIAIFPDDGENATEILKNADVAMYKAKELGKNTYQFFDSIMKNDYIKKLNIEKLLREAIINEEFVLAYQPQYNSDTKKLRGFEALIRWHSKKLGIVSPVDFIPIAEETGIIYDIGEWVIEQACRDAKYFVDSYGDSIKIAVNISPKQIMRQGFLDIIKNALKKSKLNPSNLEIEITENILIDNFEYVVKILDELRENNISISLDDFGTGYSSMRYLQRLPINLLKIDKSFVDQIDLVNRDKNLVDSIISLAHTLGMETLAEGVETKEQLQYLTKCKCGNIQGFYLGRPMYKKDIEKIIRHKKAN